MNAQKSSALDRVINGLVIVMLILFVTGGVNFSGFEIAKIDLFAWLTLVLMLYRAKHFGSPLTVHLEKQLQLLTRAPLSIRSVSVIFLGGVLFYSALQQARFLSFITNAYDMTFVERAIWSLAFGGADEPFLASPISRGGSYLGEHFSPILAVIAPFYRLLDAPLVMFIAHAALIMCGIFFIFELSKLLKLNKNQTLFMCLLYLVYQPIQSGLIFNFKEDAFYIPALFTLFYGVEKKNFAVICAGAILAITTKENAGLALVPFGLVLLFQKNKKSYGIFLVLLGAGAFVLWNFYFSSKFAGGEKNAMIATRLYFLGSSPEEILNKISTHPLDALVAVFSHIFDKKSMKYLYLVLLPFAPLILISKGYTKRVLLCGALLMALNLLFTPKVVGYHYELIVVPFLFYGTMLYLRDYNGSSTSTVKSQKIVGFLQPELLVFMLCLCAYGRSPMLNLRQAWPTAEHKCLAKTLEQIPAQLSIATHTDLMPHLHRRKELTIYKGNDALTADAVLLSGLPGMSYYGTAPYQISKETLLADKNYRIAYESSALTMWCSKAVGCAKLAQFEPQECLQGFTNLD